MTSVAMLVDQLFAAAPGGMAAYVRNLVPGLSRADPSLDVTLFHARFAEAPSDEPWMREHRVEELPWSIRRLYPEWAALRRPALPASLADREIVHTPLPVAIPPVGRAQRLVVTVHDVAFVTQPEVYPPRWRLLYRAALARAVREADAILAVSRHTAEDLVRHTRVDARRVHVTPLAPSVPATETEVAPALAALKVPSPYVLFVGTLEPRKNVTRLVRAYRRLAGRGAPHALVLAGGMGWRADELLAELRAAGPGRVVLTGRVTDVQLDALYRGASAFVYPSLYEGFGLPVLEAMARGVPCVISTSSSLPEVAGEAAVPVDPRSVAGLTEAIERVVDDADLARRLATAGRARAQRFTWDETARTTIAAYKAALSRA